MAIAPSTDIQLLACPLTADQENQLTFKTVEEQTAYFDSLVRHVVRDATYQRKDRYIPYPKIIDEIQDVNYVRYRNSNYGNKWFYAFIERMEYVNEYTTRIYIKTDVFQTWQFDFQLKPSFVEREHVEDDSFGLHTVPENLEYGPYVINEFVPMEWSTPDNSLICLQVTDFPSSANVGSSAPLTIQNGMPSGCYYLVFEKSNISDMRKWVNAYVADTKQDAILAIFPVPRTLAQPNYGISQIGKLNNSISDNTYIFTKSDSPVFMEQYILLSPIGSPLEGYLPKNNKMYTNPYCYFYLDTFTGSTVEYNYEQFVGPIQFNVYGAITAGGEFRVVPQNLNGGDSGSSSIKAKYGYGMGLTAMPQGSWNNNTYLNWRALNMDAIQIEATNDAITSTLGAASDIFNLNLLGAAADAVNYQTRVQQRMNQVRIASKMPNQARGDTANQTLGWSLGYASGGFYKMSIRTEYARKIDKYFTAFGYLVNEFKQPQYNSRKSFNYIKTIGVNLIASVIPQDDEIELKQIFDHGVTMWHSPDSFLNYNANNIIVV